MSDTSQMATSENKIRALPDHLIDQIAAGEVVERPANVLKELVENSIDAGATRVEVVLQQGGRERIQVVDDGEGMGPADLSMCLKRHTTSKIREISDLHQITSFGFRGEALSSMASVSALDIQSRTPAMAMANRLHCRFGKLSELRTCAGPPGTSITLTELFVNIPARLKFLKSGSTEYSHCSKTLKEIALGNPDVQFSLTHQDRKVQQYVTHDRRDRFVECLKPKWTPLLVEGEHEGCQLEAILSPTHHISDKGEIYLFVNGRGVRHRTLLTAVKNAYLETLGPHHVPSGALYLDIDTQWVDINVHPQKLEVRLLHLQSLYPWILASVRKAISQASSIKQIDTNSKSETTQLPMPSENPSWKTLLPAQREETYRHPSYYPTSSLPPSLNENRSEENYPSPTTTETHPFSLRYIGQLQASYLICEDAEGMLLVDQHALHEKLRFEQILHQQAHQGLSVQSLLVPYVLALPQELVPLLEENIENLAKLGFDLELCGRSDVAVRAHPALVKEEQIETILIEWLSELEKGTVRMGEQGLDSILRPLFASMACQSVVRANQRLTPAEAESLLKNFKKIELGWTCPHGRPVLFRLTYSSIRNHFER